MNHNVVFQSGLAVWVSAALLMTASCGREERVIPANSLSFDEVSYIDDVFPVEYELTDGEPVDLGILGIDNMYLYDTLMFFNTPDKSGGVSVVSSSSHKELGKFFRTGRGPGEVAFPPFVNNLQIYRKNGHLYASALNITGNIMYDFDVTASLDAGDTVIDKVDSVVADPFALKLFRIDSSRFFVCKAGEDRNTLYRYITGPDGKEHVPEPMQRLNSARVTKEEPQSQQSEDGSVSFVIPNFNILSGDIKYNPSRGLIVEVPRELNSINIYSPDGKYMKTICAVGRSIDNIEQVQNVEPVFRSSKLTLYPDFFAVIYKFLEEDRGYIRIFSYEGDALAQIEIPSGVNSFGFDIRNGSLYTLDSSTEALMRYAVGSLLDRLSE